MDLTKLRILLFLALLIPILANSDVIVLNKGVYNVGVSTSPFQVISGDYRICNLLLSQWTSSSEGFYGSLTPITLNTTNGYIINVNEPMFNVNVNKLGTLETIINQNPYISIAKLTFPTLSTSSIIYPTEGYFSLNTGNYNDYLNPTFISPITSPLTFSGEYNYTVHGLTFMYNFYERINPLTGNVMNLLDGFSNFYVPHIYEGVSDSHVVRNTVTYYSYPNTFVYWGSSSITQPILRLIYDTQFSQGLMFWNEQYASGKNVTINLIGVYTSGTSTPADGYEIYLFLNPTQWSVSSKWNNSASFPTLESNLLSGTQVSSVQGDIALPQSSTPYLMVQWDPYWQIGSSGGSGGQWNIWNITNKNDNYNSLQVTTYNGVGKNAFKPNPGDYILICVTYDPTTNTIYGVAYDLNTGQSATVSIPLGNNFTPPPSDNYLFGIGGNTGGSQGNWGLLYANYS